MLQAIRQLAILNRFFNIRGSEWSRVFFAISIRFLYRTAFVIGWTVLVALFVSHYGMYSLLFLFVINAVFSIIGSMLYSMIFARYSRHSILIGTSFIAGILIFLAARVAEINSIVFFALSIVSISIFLNQLRIVLLAYVEELFTPLNSERTFPIVEVAETLGGIVAGLLITLLSDYFSLFSFMYLMVGMLFLMIPLLLFNSFEATHNVDIKIKKESQDSYGIFSNLKAIFRTEIQAGYIWGLVGIVFLQWMIFNLLEFQYLGAIYSNLSGVIFEAGSGFEHAFIHDMGLLFMLFSTSALIIEVFVGSRIITGLGVIGAMLLHPIVTLLSLAGMTVSFNFWTAVLAKNNFTLTSVIHTNTYHISYYPINEKIREQVREFLEGIVRPLGALIGTLLVIMLSNLFKSGELVFYLNLSLISATFIFLLITYLQQKKYSNLAIDQLLNSKDKSVRMNAIDILAQKGHKDALIHLKNVLLNPNESVSIKVKILNVMAEIRNPELLLDIVECLRSDRQIIYETAIDTLMCFDCLRSNASELTYIKYQMISSLKKLYELEKNREILAKVINLMSLISNAATTEFLFDILYSKDSNNVPEAIYALGKSQDPKIADVLEKYLSSNIFLYQINAAMALVNYASYRSDALHLINSFLYSENKEKIFYGLYAIGELNYSRKKYICLKYLNSEDFLLRHQSALALAKLGYTDSISTLIKLLFSEDIEFIAKLKRSLKALPVKIYKNIDKVVKIYARRKISEYISSTTDIYENLPIETLNKLKKLYTLIDEYEELELINKILNIP